MRDSSNVRLPAHFRSSRIPAKGGTGVIVAMFHNVAGEPRVVVERREHAVQGALHIYSPDNLKVIDPDLVEPQSMIKFRAVSVFKA